MKENRRVPIPCRTGAAEMQSGDGVGGPDDAASPRGCNINYWRKTKWQKKKFLTSSRNWLSISWV